MSLIERGGVAANKALYNLARRKVPAPTVSNLTSSNRHGMIKQLVLLNVALYGGYMIAPGPIR